MLEQKPPPGGMIPFKVAAIVLYLVFAYQIAMQPLTLGANLSIGTSITIFFLHLFELYYFRALIQRAPGNRLRNAIGIFVFGIFHVAEMKRILWNARQTTDPFLDLYKPR
jgi:uncharacterized protein YhhL (DUF1145 family)